MKKGKLIAKGIGMVSMLNTCYKAKLTNDNSIIEVDVKTDVWEVYEKI